MAGQATRHSLRESPGAIVGCALSMRDARGFSLIEILVVVAIVGVLALTLTLAVGGSTSRQLDRAAERFAALLGQACEQAQLTGREIGVVFDVEGYAFVRLDGQSWRSFGASGELRARRWPVSLRPALERDGLVLDFSVTAARAPQLVCFSSGELTPFALTLALGDPPLRRRVTGSADGQVRLMP